MGFLNLFGALFVLITIVILVVLYIILGGFFLWSHYKGAPYVRSKRNRIETMMELAKIKPGEVIVDLGSGDGILVKEAAKKGAEAIGVEINPLLAWYSRRKLSWNSLSKNCRIFRCDLHDYSLKNADVVFLYLYPPTIEKLKGKLARELKADARVISNAFPFSDWDPAIEKNGVFLYKMSPHSSIGRAVAS